MRALDEEQQAQFTENFYYACLYNTLVLFAASPEYLEKLDGPLFDVPFEMESEFDYAFNEPVFSSVFTSGKVAEELHGELLEFKKEVSSLSGVMWQWEEIISNAEWHKVKIHAEELLIKLGETGRNYDFSFTNILVT